MSTLILILFWMWVICAVVKLFQLVGDYPRRITYSLGEDCATFILTLACIAWSSYLLWGK